MISSGDGIGEIVRRPCVCQSFLPHVMTATHRLIVNSHSDHTSAISNRLERFSSRNMAVVKAGANGHKLRVSELAHLTTSFERPPFL
jgi:hypothetical protein